MVITKSTNPQLNLRLVSINFEVQFTLRLPVSVVIEDRCQRGRSRVRFPRSVKSEQFRQRLATVATFLRSCVASSLSCGDGSRHSLHASAEYREYNEGLILIFDFEANCLDLKYLIIQKVFIYFLLRAKPSLFGRRQK